MFGKIGFNCRGEPQRMRWQHAVLAHRRPSRTAMEQAPAGARQRSRSPGAWSVRQASPGYSASSYMAAMKSW